MFIQLKDFETRQTFKVWIDSNSTIGNFQKSIENITGIAPHLQKLIFNGKLLNATEKNVSDYGLSENSLIYFWGVPNLSETVCIEIKALSNLLNLGFKARFSLKDPISLVKKLTEERFPILQTSKWNLYFKGRVMEVNSSSNEPLTLYDYGVQDKETLYFAHPVQINTEIAAKLTESQRKDLEAQVIEDMMKQLSESKISDSAATPANSPLKKLHRTNSSNSFAGLTKGFFLTPKELEQKKKLAAQQKLRKLPASTKPKVQENKRLCWKCNKKIGLTAIQCKCGFTFCDAHRLPENHECKIDYKKENKKILEKNLLPVIGEKIQTF